MTVKQQQALLLYLGYYVGNVDGIFGQLSKTSTLAFQRDYGLPDTGMFDPATEKKILSVVATGEKPKVSTTTSDRWDKIRYFKKSEFKCKCGGKYCNGYPTEIDMDMVACADEIRHRLGKPLNVNSGLRCSRWNSIQGGVSNSEHCDGRAADLGKPAGVTVAEMASIAEDVMGGTGGIGIYSWGIHIDTRKTKSRWNG